MDSHSWQSGIGRALGSSQRPPVDVGPLVTSLVGLRSNGACQLDDHQQSGDYKRTTVGYLLLLEDESSAAGALSAPQQVRLFANLMLTSF